MEYLNYQTSEVKKKVKFEESKEDGQIEKEARRKKMLRCVISQVKRLLPTSMHTGVLLGALEYFMVLYACVARETEKKGCF